jgi:hypothetical protein
MVTTKRLITPVKATSQHVARDEAEEHGSGAEEAGCETVDQEDGHEDEGGDTQVAQ